MIVRDDSYINKRSEVTRDIQDKIIVATFLWGNWDEVYVHKLRNAVARNLSIPHKFVCITDRQLDNTDVETWSLIPPSNIGNLAKLAMFNTYYSFDDRTIVMDLDMLITGSLDDIASYDGEFATRAKFQTGKNTWKPDGDMFVFNMTKERRQQIWDEITQKMSRIENSTRGAEVKFYDQFYERYFPNMDFIQELFPGQLISYKRHVSDRGLPRNARVVSFHGRPKPHQLKEDDWLLEYWK